MMAKCLSWSSAFTLFTTMSSTYTFTVWDKIVIHSVDDPLVGCTGILEPKWHNLIAINPSISDERGMFLVKEYMGI